MALYPTCVRCYGADSEVDVAGVCTTCQSRGSKETPVRPNPKPPGPPPTPPDPDLTRTEPKVDVATRTGPGTDGSTLATPVPAAPPPTPKTFSHYEDLEYLDAGGMGHVYTARDTRTDRTVALKLMKGVALGDSRLRARFVTEGKALARLSHPGVVQVYEVDEWDGTPFIAMEFVPGGSLAKRLRSGERPPPIEAARTMAEVASAVAAAHDKNVLHRDLKPGNVLLTEAGRPKLSDFGLAALIDESTRMTNPGGLLGTPAYMAPEQAAGNFGDVGPRTDVYGLGATLYDVLTGKPPFTGDHPMKVVQSVLRDDPVPPRKLNADVPPDLERVVLRCLEKRPQDRYESAAALATDLMRVARGEPIGKVSVIWFVKRFVRRNGKVMGAVLAVALLTRAAAMLRDRKPEPPPGPVDEMEVAKTEMKAALEAGQPYTFVGAKGKPRYARWNGHEGVIKIRNDATVSDGVALVETPHVSFLELCPDSVVEQYRLDAEIQHVTPLHPRAEVGLYAETLGTDLIRRRVSFDFSDYDIEPAHAIQRHNGLDTRVKFLDALTFVQRDGNTFDIATLTTNRFVHERTIPRTWKSVSLTVDRNGMAGELRGIDPAINGGGKTRSAAVSADEFLSRQSAIAKLVAQSPDLPPQYNAPPRPTRSAVGLYVRESHVAIRNVILTPIP